ncbi:MAG: hypothetical protein Q8R37_00960 [Nanoarchaeota archaeon]|nr:hypothetical protein [Nanoarchaeota archaeon]
MVLTKRGQGLSINVIIVAALALIVLVVLVLVFTGRIAIFERAVGQEGDAELTKMKVQYGDCHPGITEEATFRSDFNRAQSPQEQNDARAIFADEIDRCNSLFEKASCESAGCSWK